MKSEQLSPPPTSQVPPNSLWIWRLARLSGNHEELLTQANLKLIQLKCLDEASDGFFWPWQCNKEVIAKFSRLNIDVWAWGYHLGNSGSPEDVADAVLRAFDAGARKYVFDLENGLKNEKTGMSMLRAVEIVSSKVGKDAIGFTSIPYPTEFPQAPWAEISALCGFSMPQLYFLQSTEEEALAQSQKALAEYKIYCGDISIYPIFNSFEIDGKPVLRDKLQILLDSYPGASVFRAPHEGERQPAFEIDYSGVKSS